MKINKIILTSIFLIYSFGLAAANPFSAKIKQQIQSEKEEVSITKVNYQGYMIINNETFAIVQLNGEQFTIKEGEQSNEIQINKISENQIQYQYRGKSYQTHLNQTP